MNLEDQKKLSHLNTEKIKKKKKKQSLRTSMTKTKKTKDKEENYIMIFLKGQITKMI